VGAQGYWTPGQPRQRTGQPGAAISRAVGVGLDVMAPAMIAAIDQHIANAGCAHLAEGDPFAGWSFVIVAERESCAHQQLAEARIIGCYWRLP
jgi:hypothetical protein